MTNMTQNVTRPVKGTVENQVYGLVGYTDRGGGSEAYTSFKGAIMAIDVSDIDGYVQPHQSGITSASGDVFVGIAEEQVSVTSSDTSQGDKSILCLTKGTVGFPVGSITVTDLGAPIYASDDDAITTTSSNNLWIGRLINVDSINAWVRIDNATGTTNSAT